MGCTEALYRLKSEFLDRSYYMLSVFWRACFLYYRSMECASGPGDAKLDLEALRRAITSLPVDGVVARRCLLDVALLEAFLDPDEHHALWRLGHAAYFTNPTDQDLGPSIQTLYRYCEGLAQRKLRFLVNNDPGHTMDDFVVELFEAGLSTMRHYDAESDNELKLLNFARRGAKNHCLRLIDYHTAQRRARIVKTSDASMRFAQQACGTCAWLDCRVDGQSCRDAGAVPSSSACPRGRVYHERVVTTQEMCGNCRHYDVPLPGAARSCMAADRDPGDDVCHEYVARGDEQEFARTTGSLQRPLGEGSRARRLDDVIGRHDPQEQRWIQELLQELDHGVARVVRIVLGDADQAFDQWLEGRGQHRPDVSDRQIARLACEFCGVALRDVKQVLRATSSLGRVA